MRHAGMELHGPNYFHFSFFVPIYLVLESEEEVGEGAKQHENLASEMFKSSSHRSLIKDLFKFFNLYIAVVLKGSGIQPCLDINKLGRGVCVCVWRGTCVQAVGV